MQFIQLETQIAAPPERCFLLSLSVDLHLHNMAHSGERAIAGVTHGLVGLNETVTWRGRHFGLMLRHQAIIALYNQPTHFQDVMLRGHFRSFTHDHYFHATPGGGTLMRDELRFAAPLGPLGWLAETFVLKRYLTRGLIRRNNDIKRIAEGPASLWQPYLTTARTG